MNQTWTITGSPTFDWKWFTTEEYIFQLYETFVNYVPKFGYWCKIKKMSSYVEAIKTHYDLVRGLIDRGTKQQITYTDETDLTLHATKAKLLWSY